MDAIDPISLIEKYYPPHSKTHGLLVRHGKQVAAKALAVADRLESIGVDRTFLFEAAMLHDIGIFLTDSPALGCHGDKPYICHGFLGRALLEEHGLDRHALVCERHVGVGLSAEDIRRQQLPLPLREMQPCTIEEEIVCYADKFYSKNGRPNHGERTIPEIVAKLRQYGEPMALKFQAWARRFERGPGPPSPPEASR